MKPGTYKMSGQIKYFRKQYVWMSIFPNKRSSKSVTSFSYFKLMYTHNCEMHAMQKVK